MFAKSHIEYDMLSTSEFVRNSIYVFVQILRNRVSTHPEVLLAQEVVLVLSIWALLEEDEASSVHVHKVIFMVLIIGKSCSRWFALPRWLRQEVPYSRREQQNAYKLNEEKVSGSIQRQTHCKRASLRGNQETE